MRLAALPAFPLWAIPVAGAIVAPLTTWLPMLILRYPWLSLEYGLPFYLPQFGLDVWPAVMFNLTALSVIAVIVGREDWRLGAAIALAALTLTWRGFPRVVPDGTVKGVDPTHAMLFGIGALLLLAIRQTPPAWHRRIAAVLASCGLFQAVYVLQQSWLHYDLLWGPVFGATLNQVIRPVGTLGTVDGATAYIAITAPLMPLWGLALAIPAVFSGKSLGAIVALLIGLGVKYRAHRYRWALAAAVVVALLYGIEMKNEGMPLERVAAAGRGLTSRMWVPTSTVQARLDIQAFAVRHWATHQPVLGYGLGGWQLNIPQQQYLQQYGATREMWREAHSEPIQWMTETGIAGTLLLAIWLWHHRAMFVDWRWGASVAALAADSLTFFPLHVVSLALLSLIVVGLATAPQPEGATT